jgi:transcriptional regulator with XRE-family HTH domain
MNDYHHAVSPNSHRGFKFVCENLMMHFVVSYRAFRNNIRFLIPHKLNTSIRLFLFASIFALWLIKVPTLRCVCVVDLSKSDIDSLLVNNWQILPFISVITFLTTRDIQSGLSFRDWLKNKRLEQGLSLRAFCKKNNEDPSNWSKLERGVLKPPKQILRLEEIASYLNIEKDSEEWKYFCNLANASRGIIPEDLRTKPSVISSLPLLYDAFRLMSKGNLKSSDKRILDNLLNSFKE